MRIHFLKINESKIVIGVLSGIVLFILKLNVVTMIGFYLQILGKAAKNICDTSNFENSSVSPWLNDFLQEGITWSDDI